MWISMEAFCYAIRQWKNLEGMDVDAHSLEPEILGAIHSCCKNFVSMRVAGKLSKVNAANIVRCLPKLKSLYLSNTKFMQGTLLVILKGCKQLESLDITGVGTLGMEPEVQKLAGLKSFESSDLVTYPSLRSGTYASSTSERIAAGSITSGPGLSPSSSMGSLSSEKSTLNPNAKEFKLNPNAKSFTPSTSFRPPTPMSEGSFYYAGNLSAVPPTHSVPMGIGIGHSFGGHQPVFNPQVAQVQSPQAYIHPNGPMYGQQMILGQPRPVYYMPTYPPEMQYKGRNF